MNDEQLLARIYEARGQLLEIAKELSTRMSAQAKEEAKGDVQAK